MKLYVPGDTSDDEVCWYDSERETLEVKNDSGSPPGPETGLPSTPAPATSPSVANREKRAGL